MSPRSRLILLRIFFFGAALGWGVSFVGAVFPWPRFAANLFRLGGVNVPDSPMIVYWVRMACAVYGFIGIFYLLLGLNPRKYRSMIPFSAALMLGVGAILLVHGLRLGLPALPFTADVTFCLGIGTGILFNYREALDGPGKVSWLAND
jgi:hypothetical protein